MPWQSRLRWLRRGPALAAVLALALAAGFGASLVAHENRVLSAYLVKEAAEARWMVFLKNFADLPSIEQRLRSLPGVREVRLVTKSQALEAARQDPNLAEGLKLTSRNPFPDSFEVLWQRTLLRTAYLVPLSESVGKWDGVDGVGFDRSRLDRVTLMSRLSAERELAAASLTCVAALVALFLAGRVLFWSRWIGWQDLAACSAAGILGGALGAAMVWSWLGPYLWHGIAAGAAFGVLSGLWKAVSDE